VCGRHVFFQIQSHIITFIFCAVTLVGLDVSFRGFFIQARAESNQNDESSIVGMWTPMNDEAQIVQCNGVNGVSLHYTSDINSTLLFSLQAAITHTNSDMKTQQVFNWRAPDIDIGRIHFL